MKVTDRQWEQFKGLPSYERIVSGSGTLESWNMDCRELAEAFGLKSDTSGPDKSTTGEAERPQFSAEEEAHRGMIDWARSHFVAVNARQRNREVVEAAREFRGEQSPEQFIEILEQLAISELSEPEIQVHKELVGLSKLLQAAREAPEQYHHAVDTGALYQEALKHAEGVLEIVNPNTSMVHRIPYFGLDGEMKGLHEIIIGIASQYGWTGADAATFLFFDWVPLNRSCTVGLLGHNELSGLSRIVMHIDPTMSPDDVRELYRQERSKYCNYSLRVSNRHLLAAMSAFVHGAAMSWPERFQEHNRLTEKDPNLQYKEAKFFRRDATKAYEKLMHPKLG